MRLIHRRSLALSTCTLLLACQPGAPGASETGGSSSSSSSSGGGGSEGTSVDAATVADTDPTTGAPDVTTTADELGTGTDGPITGFDSEDGDPTAPPPKPTDAPSLACAGARYVTVAEPGSIHGLALDSPTHLTAFGPGYLANGEFAATLVDLDGAGEVVQTRLWGANGGKGVPHISHAGYAAGALYVHMSEYPADGSDEAHTHLRKFDGAGALVFDVDLGLYFDARPQSRGFAVAPTGDTAITSWNQNAGRIDAIRHDASGAQLWAQTVEDGLSVQTIDAGGRMVATRNADGMRVLNPDGSTDHDIDFVTDYEGAVAVDGAGNVTIAHTSSGGASVHVGHFDPAGAQLWHIAPPLPSGGVGGIAVNASGEIAVVGSAYDEGPRIAFAVKLAPDGAVLGTYACDPAAPNQGYAAALDDAGTLYIGGFVEGPGSHHWGFVAAFD